MTPPNICTPGTPASGVQRDTEAFWKGTFGDDYVERAPGHVDAVAAMMMKILLRRPIHSVIEFGAGSGANLRAMLLADHQLELTAVEINKKAIAQIPRGIETIEQSMLDFKPERRWDMTMTRGVLIHIDPNDLLQAYTALHHASRRYVLVAEYFNPAPVEIPYRGHSGKLWKADFAGEMMKLFPDLFLVDYGFVYDKDPLHPQDNITWFLMEKQQ